MTTDPKRDNMDVSGNSQVAEVSPRYGTNRAAQPNPSGRRKVFGAAALLVVAAVVGWGVYHRSHSKTTTTSGAAGARGQNLPVPVMEGIVSTRDVPIYLDGLGTVQAFNTVTVHTRVDGQLIKVAFMEGQDVKTGDVLVQLDPAPYQAALDQAVAKKAQDAAQLANARLDLLRYADLMKTDSITQQIYDTQKALVSQFEATVNADQAAAEIARVNLDYTTIRSPIDGRIGIRQVDTGNIVHASDANGLVVVTQLRPISVVFTLPEQTLPKLQQFQSPDTAFTVLAVSRDNTNVLGTGVLAVIDNQIDTTTGTLKLKATFANENLRLWPGQFVNTRLLLTTRKASPVVPASVVQRGPDGAFAFVIQEDLTVRMRPLKIAQIEGGMALIDEGLRPGERVVVDGQYKLQPGSHVIPAESSGNSGAGGGGKDGPKTSGSKTNRGDTKPRAALEPLQTMVGLTSTLAPDPLPRGEGDFSPRLGDAESSSRSDGIFAEPTASGEDAGELQTFLTRSLLFPLPGGGGRGPGGRSHTSDDAASRPQALT